MLVNGIDRGNRSTGRTGLLGEQEYWGNRSTGRETCYSATTSTANLTMSYLGSNPVIRGDRQATERLSQIDVDYIYIYI